MSVLFAVVETMAKYDASRISDIQKLDFASATAPKDSPKVRSPVVL